MADAFARDALEAHNNLRAHHHAPPMTLNPEITAIAQKWADKLAKEDTGLRHTKPDQRMYRGEAMGENIAMKFDSRVDDYKGASPTKQWYSEIKDYMFEHHKGNGKGPVGHFTQVIWKGCKEMGIARAKSSKGVWYAVANYWPAGNFMGQNHHHVPTPKDGKALDIHVDEPSMDDDMGMGQNMVTKSTPGPAKGGAKVSRKITTKTSTVNGKKVTKKITEETTEDEHGNKSVKTTEETV